MKSVEELTKAMLILTGYYDDQYKSSREDSIVMVRLPEGLAQQIRGWGEQHLTDEILYRGKPGDTDDYAREWDIHITVLWGVRTDSPLSILDVLERNAVDGFDMRLGKITLFDTGEDYDVVKVDVKGSGLHALRKLLTDGIEHEAQTHPVYRPHITIGYVKKGLAAELVGNDSFADEVAHVDRVVFSSSGGRETVLPLANAELA